MTSAGVAGVVLTNSTQSYPSLLLSFGGRIRFRASSASSSSSGRGGPTGFTGFFFDGDFGPFYIVLTKIGVSYLTRDWVGATLAI
jgi:hypothetical protein